MSNHADALRDSFPWHRKAQDVINALADGWLFPNETWTYASATTITVPTGAASKYSVGDRLKLTQTTVKYFYVVGVADTTLTITGGTDYTLANAAITDPRYSHEPLPVGFPSRFNWTPSITTSGAMTWTGINVKLAVFNLIGKTVNFWVAVAGTVGGTPSTRLTVTLPLAVATFGVDMPIGTYAVSGGADRPCVAFLLSGNPNLNCYIMTDAGQVNWTAGTCEPRCVGSYLID